MNKNSKIHRKNLGMKTNEDIYSKLFNRKTTN